MGDEWRLPPMAPTAEPPAPLPDPLAPSPYQLGGEPGRPSGIEKRTDTGKFLEGWWGCGGVGGDGP